jgi:hypothetical protein
LVVYIPEPKVKSESEVNCIPKHRAVEEC